MYPMLGSQLFKIGWTPLEYCSGDLYWWYNRLWMGDVGARYDLEIAIDRHLEILIHF